MPRPSSRNACAAHRVTLASQPVMSEEPVGIRYVPMETVVIYPVTADELSQLETGGSGTAILGVSTFLLGSGLSFLGSLLTAPTEGTRFLILLVLTASFLVLGAGLLGIWWLQRKKGKTLASCIRARDAAGTGTRQNAPGPPSPTLISSD